MRPAIWEAKLVGVPAQMIRLVLPGRNGQVCNECRRRGATDFRIAIVSGGLPGSRQALMILGPLVASSPPRPITLSREAGHRGLAGLDVPLQRPQGSVLALCLQQRYVGAVLGEVGER